MLPLENVQSKRPSEIHTSIVQGARIEKKKVLCSISKSGCKIIYMNSILNIYERQNRIKI